MGKEEVLSQRGAWNVYDRWFEDSRVFFFGGTDNLEKAFRGISRQPGLAAKDWADSYLIAFAEAADLSVIRFDKALKQKSGTALLLR